MMKYMIIFGLVVLIGCSPSDNPQDDPPTTKKLILSVNQTLRSINLDGSELSDFLESGGNVGGVDIDYRNNYIYYAISSGYGKIDRALLDGSKKETVIDGYTFPHGDGTSFFSDVSLDLGNNHLYFCDLRSNGIYRSNLDGSNLVIIIPPSGSPSNSFGLRQFELDLSHKKIYWVDNSKNQIARAEIDGSNQEVIVSASTLALALDIKNGTIYWIVQNDVWCAALNGENSKPLVKTDLGGKTGIVFDIESEKLFWTDNWSSGSNNSDTKLFSSDLNGENVQTLYNFGPSALDLIYYLSLVLY